MTKRYGKKAMACLACALFVLSAFAVTTAWAAPTAQDGLEATLTFSKSEYAANETVKATLTVENTNSSAVHNVRTEITLPEGVTHMSGNLAQDVPSLPANESRPHEVTFTKAATATSLPQANDGPDASATNSSGTKLAQTGDGLDPIACAALALAAGGALAFVALKRRWVRAKDLAPFVLCFALIGMVAMPATASAAPERKSFSVESTVRVDGQDLVVKALVSYDHESLYQVTVNKGSGSGPYPENDTVTIEAEPASEDQQFAGWRVDSGSIVLADASQAITTFTMPAENVEVTATYSAKPHTIAATAGKHGTISPAGQTKVQPGKSQTYTITPNEGCSIVDVEVDGTSVGPVTTYTFDNVTRDHTIKATFSISTFKIETIVEVGGTITPENPRLEYGSDQTFQLKPDPGCYVAHVYVDGTQVTPASSYTFYNVTEDHSIVVVFLPNPQP